MFILKQFVVIAWVTAFTVTILPQKANAQVITKGVKNIILVHGAFADGSSWAKVIPLLQGIGYVVVAVQNPLTSFEEDVAATKRAIASIQAAKTL